MKKISFTLFLVVIVALASTFVLAEANGVTKTDVPFSFYVGDKLMAAGTYFARVGDDERQLTIQSADGSNACLTTDLPSNSVQPVTPGMQFYHLGGTYFLRAVKDSDQEFQLGESKLEKQMVRQLSVAQTSVPANGY